MAYKEMTTSQYRCVVAHVIHWNRGLKEAIEDAGLQYSDKEEIIHQLWKAGYEYDEEKDSLIYREGIEEKTPTNDLRQNLKTTIEAVPIYDKALDPRSSNDTIGSFVPYTHPFLDEGRYDAFINRVIDAIITIDR